MKRKILIIISVSAILFSGTYLANRGLEAQEFQKIAPTTVKIDKFGVCRNVTNTGAQSFLVPLKTKSEWCSFIKSAPNLANVSLTTCQTCAFVQACGCGNCSGDWVCAPFNAGTCP